MDNAADGPGLVQEFQVENDIAEVRRVEELWAVYYVSSVQLNEGGIFVMVRLVGVFDCALILLLAGGGNALGNR